MGSRVPILSRSRASSCVKSSFGLKKRCCFLWRRTIPSFLCAQLESTALKSFHDMLNHVKMVNDDLCFWQGSLNCWTKRGAHIHTYRFDSIRIAQSLQQLDDLFLFSSLAHLKAHPCTQDRTE